MGDGRWGRVKMLGENKTGARPLKRERKEN